MDFYQEIICNTFPYEQNFVFVFINSNEFLLTYDFQYIDHNFSRRN